MSLKLLHIALLDSSTCRSKTVSTYCTKYLAATALVTSSHALNATKSDIVVIPIFLAIKYASTRSASTSNPAGSCANSANISSVVGNTVFLSNGALCSCGVSSSGSSSPSSQSAS